VCMADLVQRRLSFFCTGQGACVQYRTCKGASLTPMVSPDFLADASVILQIASASSALARELACIVVLTQAMLFPCCALTLVLMLCLDFLSFGSLCAMLCKTGMIDAYVVAWPLELWQESLRAMLCNKMHY